MKTDRETLDELLSRGVAEVIVREQLEKKLLSGQKLRIKFGIDPTGDLLHIGHAVALLKLKEFQDLGHTVILLIGDFTAQIGDPTGRNAERETLSQEQVEKNMKTYLDQAGTILNIKRVEVRYNSEWFSKMDLGDFLGLAELVTFTQLGQRADFKKRIAAGGDITLKEFVYPLLQGFDSHMLEADVEIGGTDQKFNLLMGRPIQEKYLHKKGPQDILMVPLLEGTDGVKKMSKTAANFIALTDTPAEMYGKVMRVSDSLIWKYFELATRVSARNIEALKEEVARGGNPRDAKMRLGREIVSLYHGEKKALEAEQYFISLFQKKEVPEEMPVIHVSKKKWSVIDLLLESKLVASKSEARRVIEQKGLCVNDVIIDDILTTLSVPERGLVLKKGKRHFVKILTR